MHKISCIPETPNRSLYGALRRNVFLSYSSFLRNPQAHIKRVKTKTNNYLLFSKMNSCFKKFLEIILSFSFALIRCHLVKWRQKAFLVCRLHSSFFACSFSFFRATSTLLAFFLSSILFQSSWTVFKII